MSDKSYISVYHDRKLDKILIWERPIEGGERTLRMLPASWYFYVPDDEGTFTTITGVKVSRKDFANSKEFREARDLHKQKFESDVRPDARALMDNYYGVPTPRVHYAFVDIEVDYSSKIGWSSPENPYAAINAVTIYQSWTGEYNTYVVPPKGWKGHETFEADIAASWAEHKLGFKPNVTLCADERELLLYMLGDLEDADIVSGWNSEFFDIPYIIKRLSRILGEKAVAAMSFKGAAPPEERIVQRFGSPAITFTLYGRTHLDYLDLFKKFTFEGRVSYSLANIASEELDIPKIDYEGTLEQLYKNDFVHFTTYNARDVEVLVQLDIKFKLMQLVNQMAHENTVPYLAILGTVRYVETGIMNRAKYVHGLISTDKNMPSEKNDKVEGAIVMTPLAGLHDWLGSVDITSLYPSVIRALNMSVETFSGQFREEERAWRGICAKDSNTWTLVMGDQEIEATGAEWYEFIRAEGYAFSAFGTLFDQSKPGMVADTLTYWFEERKRLQAEKKKYSKLAKEETDPVKKKEYEAAAEHYDLLQLTKKIQLNSCYGALLNEAFRFGRREIGASVTGTGRQITTHMGQTIGTLIDGKPCQIIKKYASNKSKFFEGEELSKARMTGDWDLLDGLDDEPRFMKREWSEELNREVNIYSGAVYYTKLGDVVYGDTDSCYFKTRGTSYEDAVARADDIAAKTNATFPAFMAEAFNCTDGREKLIKAAREVVAERGLFLLAKKKYTLKVVNLEGADLREKPKLKSMGSEIKKADTPKVVQDFLKGLMDLVLGGKQYPELEKFVNEHRGHLIHRTKDLLALGVAKQINNLDSLYAEWKRVEKPGRGKVRLPGHVRAAVNYNEMVDAHDPGGAKLLRSGDKGVVFYLRPNQNGFTSIAFPADIMHFPVWFDENFKIDMVKTEERMIDSKLEGIFEVLGTEVPTLQQAFLNRVFQF